MCGIAGLWGEPGRLEEWRLDALASELSHRGPDGAGRHVDRARGLGLVHRRLSIIDIDGGAQPLYNEDRSLVLVTNGEIYNYRELRAECLERGHRFRTASDSEVIVHLYEDLGIEAVKRLRGMFAFALYDAHAELLVLGRDRLGKKPLVYGEAAGRFGFASELNALARALGPLPLRREALASYLALGYVPAPWSVYEGIHKLLPGHVAVVRPGGGVTTLRYWEPRFEPKLALTRAEALVELRERLSEAVRLRLAADVPLGLFLSGGVDSSVVGAAMAAESAGPVASFTAGFVEADFDESAAARTAARSLGSAHHELPVPQAALEAFDALVYRCGEPYADSSALATWWLAAGTARHVKTVLTGDGGDELFAGYPRYRLLERLRRYGAVLPPGVGAALQLLPLGRRARRAGELLGLSEAERALELVAIHGSAQWPALLREPELAARGAAGVVRAVLGAAARDPGERLLEADLLTYLPNDLLVKMDMACMAHGLEARSPLLDHELVEFVLRLPPALKRAGRRPKALLRDTFAHRFPKGFFDRPKQGFGLPIRAWFRAGSASGLGDKLRGVLASESLRSLELIDADFALRLLSEHELGTANHQHRLWALLVLGRWLELAPGLGAERALAAGSSV